MTFQHHLAMRVSFTCRNKRQILSLLSRLLLIEVSSLCWVSGKWKHLVLGVTEQPPWWDSHLFHLPPVVCKICWLSQILPERKALLFIPRMPLRACFRSKFPNAPPPMVWKSLFTVKGPKSFPGITLTMRNFLFVFSQENTLVLIFNIINTQKWIFESYHCF